ncbi:hypothetical protein F5Y17DRAFT_5818 [Xylariaceae sp. FL0594]|nr:hypothetical protein F5Y17DRAFT_5818 [Xylariaceae sp. FL0594]
MPTMAGTLGFSRWEWEWEPFTAPVAAFVENWLVLRYLLPLISFVCVGLEGWCFFDLMMRRTLGARSVVADAVVKAAGQQQQHEPTSSLDYDVVKDFPNGGFEPSNKQLCLNGLLGIRLHTRHSTACLSNPAKPSQPAKSLKTKTPTAPCRRCLIITTRGPGPSSSTTTHGMRRRQRISYIAI